MRPFVTDLETLQHLEPMRDVVRDRLRRGGSVTVLTNHEWSLVRSREIPALDLGRRRHWMDMQGLRVWARVNLMKWLKENYQEGGIFYHHDHRLLERVRRATKWSIVDASLIGTTGPLQRTPSSARPAVITSPSTSLLFD